MLLTCYRYVIATCPFYVLLRSRSGPRCSHPQPEHHFYVPLFRQFSVLRLSVACRVRENELLRSRAGPRCSHLDIGHHFHVPSYLTVTCPTSVCCCGNAVKLYCLVAHRQVADHVLPDSNTTIVCVERVCRLSAVRARVPLRSRPTRFQTATSPQVPCAKWLHIERFVSSVRLGSPKALSTHARKASLRVWSLGCSSKLDGIRPSVLDRVFQTVEVSRVFGSSSVSRRVGD